MKPHRWTRDAPRPGHLVDELLRQPATLDDLKVCPAVDLVEARPPLFGVGLMPAGYPMINDLG
jgi:hypothetical protein